MLQTRAEATRYAETSLHRDVMEFLARLDDPRVARSSFGTSPGGRDLPLVVLQARRPDAPKVLIINGIHAGEVEGKEACLMLLRDLLHGRHGDLLDELTLVVVPLYNPDGNDALDPGNRKLDLPGLSGQIGPALVGTRVQGQGINLNRDYLRQAAPESRLLSANVLRAWQPDLTIDTHSTNGSVHRMAMTYDVPHTVASGRAEPIRFMREQMMPAVKSALAREHGLLAGWYGNFVEDERALDAQRAADPAATVGEGWMTYTHHPRFGSNYRGLGGRLDLLLECYSYLPFADRVRTTYATLLESLRWVAAHGAAVREVVAAAETPRDQVAVRYRLDAFAEPIEIPTRSPRTPDGEPVVARLAHFADFVGSTVVARPRAYLVPPGVAAHLANHGLPVTPASGPIAVDVARVVGLGSQGGRKILESASVGDLQVEWRRETRSGDGLQLVSTENRQGAVAVYLCEPESDDGAVENGLVPPPAAGDDFPIYRVAD